MWSNSGSFIWRAYSDGEDQYKEKYTCLSLEEDKYKTVEGIRGMCEFRTTPSGQIEGRRFPCRCLGDEGAGCRVGGVCIYPHLGMASTHDATYTSTVSVADAAANKANAKAKRKQAEETKAREFAEGEAKRRRVASA